MTRYFKRGYSLVEIAVVIAIMSVLLTIGATGFRNYLNHQGMNTAIEHTRSLLSRARTYTLAAFDDTGGSGRNYGVHIDAGTDTITLFASNSTCANLGPVVGAETIIREVDIVSVNFAGTEDIVFQRISGDAKVPGAGACSDLGAAGGTIVLRSRNSNLQKTIRILSTGVISLE